MLRASSVMSFHLFAFFLRLVLLLWRLSLPPLRFHQSSVLGHVWLVGSEQPTERKPITVTLILNQMDSTAKN